MSRSQLNINIPPDLLAEIKSRAKERGTSVTKLVKEVLSKEVHARSDANSNGVNNVEQRITRLENQISYNRLHTQSNEYISLQSKESEPGIHINSKSTEAFLAIARLELKNYALKKMLTPEEAWDQLEKNMPIKPEKAKLMKMIIAGWFQISNKEIEEVIKEEGCCPIIDSLELLTGKKLPELRRAHPLYEKLRSIDKNENTVEIPPSPETKNCAMSDQPRSNTYD